MTGWSRICCATDFSECSRRALAAAVALVRSHPAELTVVHALGLSPTEDYAAIERTLEAWRSDAERLAGRHVELKLVIGAPAAEIARFLEDGAFDLLVIGTRGLTGVRRVLLGSVAADLARMAPCSVLVVRERSDADEAHA